MNKFRFLGIIALAAIIGFSTTSCGDNGGGGGGGWLGMELTFTNAQVTVWDDYNDVITSFDGNRLVVLAGYWEHGNGSEWVSVGEDGAITDGRFTFSIGEPLFASLNYANVHNWYVELNDMFSALSIAPTGAQFASLWFSTPYPDEEVLLRTRGTETLRELLWYIWADHDVTITGTSGSDSWEEGGVTYTMIVDSLNLNLQRGWNAVLMREQSGATSTRVTISHSHPNLPWVLFPEYDYYNND